ETTSEDTSTDETTSEDTSTDETTSEDTSTDETSTEDTSTDETTSEDTTTDETSTGADDSEQAVIDSFTAFWAATKEGDYDTVGDLTCRKERATLPGKLEKYLKGRESKIVVTVEGATVNGEKAQVDSTVEIPGEDTDSAPWDMVLENGEWLLCDS
ncbi:MAG: hypothetical protein INR72_15950, partial [Williamsia herbipolensis]|nr:hypothetical protein [Williamsia herbipolensis]